MARLSEAARIVPITVLRDAAFSSVGNLNHRTPERLVYVEDAKYAAHVAGDDSIACAITTPALADHLGANQRVGLATAENPRAVFFRYHNHLARETDFYWREFETEIAAGAVVWDPLESTCRHASLSIL